MRDPFKWLADEAGVSITPCGPGWGGRYGYTSKDHPNCMTCGFATKAEARRNWAESTFGEHAAAALLKLMERSHAG